jgi:eukaryotic-like serine/threonine-protein kinase
LKKINNIQIIQPLNSGGTAHVYLGVDVYTGAPVAVKELKTSFFKSEFVREKFLEEANQYLYLDHPNIVKLKDFIKHDDTHYLIMEYVDGKNLSDHISKVTGPIPIQNIALILNEVLSALGYVHDKGLIHLDIKPSNIMLSDRNEIKVIDFGISHDTKGKAMDKVMGSPSYMSPEQIEGKDIDFRSDIYSLGITLYEMVSGKLPFSNCESREEMFDAIKNNQIPYLEVPYDFDGQHEDKINQIIQKATRKELKARYQSCEEFQLDLLEFI